MWLGAYQKSDVGVPAELAAKIAASTGLTGAALRDAARRELKKEERETAIANGDIPPGQNANGDGGYDPYLEMAVGGTKFSLSTVSLVKRQAEQFFSGKDGAFKDNSYAAKNAATVSTAMAMGVVSSENGANAGAPKAGDEALKAQASQVGHAANDVAKKDATFASHLSRRQFYDEDGIKVLKRMHGEHYEVKEQELAAMRKSAAALGVDVAPPGRVAPPVSERYRGNLNFALSGNQIRSSSPQPAATAAHDGQSNNLHSDNSPAAVASKPNFIQPAA